MKYFNIFSILVIFALAGCDQNSSIFSQENKLQMTLKEALKSDYATLTQSAQSSAIKVANTFKRHLGGEFARLDFDSAELMDGKGTLVVDVKLYLKDGQHKIVTYIAKRDSNQRITDLSLQYISDPTYVPSLELFQNMQSIPKGVVAVSKDFAGKVSSGKSINYGPVYFQSYNKIGEHTPVVWNQEIDGKIYSVTVVLRPHPHSGTIFVADFSSLMQ